MEEKINYGKVVLITEESLEGIFTAVYDGWGYADRGSLVEIRTEPEENFEFFCTYREISADREKAEKVNRSVRRKLGVRIYEDICYAAASIHPHKGTAIFYVLRQALGGKRCNRQVMEALADPYVNLVAKLRIKVWHEMHRFFGFVRFREVGGGILFSKIAPENDILTMLAPHFENRFPNEAWMLFDESRGKVLVHRKGEKCVLHTGFFLSGQYREALEEREMYEDLWRTFCAGITIEERKNEKLQKHLVPKKFRENMTEFSTEGEDKA